MVMRKDTAKNVLAVKRLFMLLFKKGEIIIFEHILWDLFFGIIPAG